MHLTMQAVLGLPGADELGWVDDVLSALDPEKGALGAVVARAEGEPRGHVAMLWPDPSDDGPGRATADALPGSVALGPVHAYRVLATALPVDPGAPRCLQLTQFTGPRSAEWVEAFERAGRDRIWPAVRDVPGAAATLTGVAADGGCLTLTLAESRESIGESVRRLMSTQLLPGERPELLTGPDRIEIQRVVHAVLPEGPWSLR